MTDAATHIKRAVSRLSEIGDARFPQLTRRESAAQLDLVRRELEVAAALLALEAEQLRTLEP